MARQPDFPHPLKDARGATEDGVVQPDLKDGGATTRIYVCTTCRSAGEPLEPKEARAGARLHAELAAAVPAGMELAAFEVVGVECLSVCKRPCTVSFASPGKWTYVYGDLMPDVSAETILAGARLYSDAHDGIIPWKQRPDALKKGVVARIPPLQVSPVPMKEAAE